jgi:hypothetical protein
MSLFLFNVFVQIKCFVLCLFTLPNMTDLTQIAKVVQITYLGLTGSDSTTLGVFIYSIMYRPHYLWVTQPRPPQYNLWFTGVDSAIYGCIFPVLLHILTFDTLTKQ